MTHPSAPPPPSGPSGPAWSIGLSVVWALMILPSLFLAFLTIFMFDAPGAEKNPITIVLALSLATLPMTLVVGFVASLILRNRPPGAQRTTAALALLPLANGAAFGFAWLLLGAVCGGRFAC
jgi:asparagine N-glycosylation enzyme membrane subunit Stt3